MTRLKLTLCIFFIHSVASFDLNQESINEQNTRSSHEDPPGNKINRQDYGGDIELIDQVPRRFYIDPKWNDQSWNDETCKKSFITIANVLNLILDLILNVGDLPKIDSAKDLLDLINTYTTNVPAEYQDADLNSKLQQVVEHFGFQQLPHDSNLRSANNTGSTGSNMITRVNFKQKLPRIEEPQCKAAFLGLMGVAYKSYLHDAKYDNCVAPYRGYSPVDDQSSKIVYKLLLEELKPYISANPNAVNIYDILHRYHPGQVIQIPERVPFTNSNKLNALLQEILFLQNNNGIQPWRLNTNYPGLIQVQKRVKGLPYPYPFQGSFGNVQQVYRPPQLNTWNSATVQGFPRVPLSYQFNTLNSNIPWQNKNYYRDSTGTSTNADAGNKEKLLELTGNKFQKSNPLISHVLPSSPFISTFGSESEIAHRPQQTDRDEDLLSYKNPDNVQSDHPSSEPLLREEETKDPNATTQLPDAQTTYQTNSDPAHLNNLHTSSQVEPTTETYIHYLPPQDYNSATFNKLQNINRDNPQNWIDKSQQRYKVPSDGTLNLPLDVYDNKFDSPPRWNQGPHNANYKDDVFVYDDLLPVQTIPKTQPQNNFFIAHHSKIPVPQSKNVLISQYGKIPNIKGTSGNLIPWNIKLAGTKFVPVDQNYQRPNQFAFNDLFASNIVPPGSSQGVGNLFEYRPPLSLDKDHRIRTLDVTQFLKPLKNPPDAVRLTYVVRIVPPVYEPYYYVTYTIPYGVFISNVHSLLTEDPSLKLDIDKLFQEVIAVSNVTAISPDLKYLPQPNIDWNIQDGKVSLVNTKQAVKKWPGPKRHSQQVHRLVSNLKGLTQDISYNGNVKLLPNPNLIKYKYFQTPATATRPQYYGNYYYHDGGNSGSTRSNINTHVSEVSPLVLGWLKKHQQNPFGPVQSVEKNDHTKIKLSGDWTNPSPFSGLSPLYNGGTFSTRARVWQHPSEGSNSNQLYSPKLQRVENWPKQNNGDNQIGLTDFTNGNWQIQNKPSEFVQVQNIRGTPISQTWLKLINPSVYGNKDDNLIGKGLKIGQSSHRLIHQSPNVQFNENWPKYSKLSGYNQDEDSRLDRDLVKRNQAEGFGNFQKDGNEDSLNADSNKKSFNHGIYGDIYSEMNGKNHITPLLSDESSNGGADNHISDSWKYEPNPDINQSQYAYKTHNNSLISQTYQQNYNDNGNTNYEFLPHKNKIADENYSSISANQSEEPQVVFPKLKGIDIKSGPTLSSDGEVEDSGVNKYDSEDLRPLNSDHSVIGVKESNKEASTSTTDLTVPEQVKRNADFFQYDTESTTEVLSTLPI